MSKALRFLAALDFLRVLLLAGLFVFYVSGPAEKLGTALGLLLGLAGWASLLIVVNLAHLQWIDANRRALAWAGLAAILHMSLVVLSVIHSIYIFRDWDRWQRHIGSLELYIAWQIPAILVFSAAGLVLYFSTRPAMARELEERRRLRPIFLGPGPAPFNCERCGLAFHAPEGQPEGLCPACKNLLRARIPGTLY